MRHNDMLTVAETIEAARDRLTRAQSAVKTLHASVTDPLAAAIVQIDQSLKNLDVLLGASARKQHRERPRDVEPGS